MGRAKEFSIQIYLGFELIGTLNDFEFNITAVLFSSYALVDNTPVNPTETKITIGIKNFAFGDDASVLALQLKATSKLEIGKEDKTTESEIKVKSALAEGYQASGYSCYRF